MYHCVICNKPNEDGIGYCHSQCAVDMREGKTTFWRLRHPDIPLGYTPPPTPDTKQSNNKPVSALKKQRFRILQRDGFKCVYCGRGPKDNVVLHIDHIIPKSKGGSSQDNNLCTACSDCNLGKGATRLDPKLLAAYNKAKSERFETEAAA